MSSEEEIRMKLNEAIEEWDSARNEYEMLGNSPPPAGLHPTLPTIEDYIGVSLRLINAHENVERYYKELLKCK